MTTACIIISDVDADSAEVAMSVVFDGGFNQDSPAHAAVRRLLDYVDSLKIEIREPIATEVVAQTEPLLVGADGCAIVH